MNVLYKVLGIVAVVVIVAVIAIWGVRQYGNSRVAAQELGTVKEAVSDAVAERKLAVKADAQASTKKAAVQQDMRSAGNLARKEMQLGIKAPTGPAGPCPDPRDHRVLNEFIQRGNRAIESSR